MRLIYTTWALLLASAIAIAVLGKGADWLVDGAFFAGLGYGTWVARGDILWFWLGLAATAWTSATSRSKTS